MEESGTGISEVYAHFTRKQQAAFDAVMDHKYVLYGGARGGGKSRWLRWSLFMLHVYWYQTQGMTGVRSGLFCETYPDLRDRQISKIKLEFPPEIGEVKETQADGLAFFFNEANGGGMMTLRNLDDPSKYQSAEFAAVAVDEVTKNTKETFDILRGSLRWPNIIDTKFLGATNPGGIGHMWVKQLWVDRDFPPELRRIEKEFKFIQSLPADNPHLPESYWDDLKTLPPDLQRAWVYGDWDVFAGQAFPGWRDHLHIIQPFDIPTHWAKWRAVDWGFANPFCCLWFAKEPSLGRTYIYRELYTSGLTDQEQARTIRDMTPETGVTITYADPAMWQRKNREGEIYSTADEYYENGIALERADNDRLSGKRKVDRMLMNMPDGKPGIQVFSTCANLTRTLPALAYDKTRVEDVDTKQEDHAYDTLRYGISNLDAQIYIAPEPEYDTTNMELLEDII